MAGKVTNNSPSGVLILIIPIALAIVLLFTAWPVVLALILGGAAWSLWQRYQWLQWSQQINPIFHQLIEQNQGCATVLDLAMKANISGTAARRYLDAKAQEFGVTPVDYEEKGRVYQFITANILGSIFDDSEPLSQAKSEPPTLKAEEQTQPVLMQEEKAAPEKREVQPQPEPVKTQEADGASQTPQVEEIPQPLKAQEANGASQTPQLVEPLPRTHPIFQSLIQSELARRLDVHSSTVYKRRDDPDFAEWSRSRDPEGIAWEYSEDTKEFYPVETEAQ